MIRRYAILALLMRLKLVLLTSLIAAMIGAGASFIVGSVLHGYWVRLIELYHHSWIDIVLVLAPMILTAIAAAIFVYRHTALQRKAQAAITVILALVLAILATYPLAWLIPTAPPAN